MSTLNLPPYTVFLHLAYSNYDDTFHHVDTFPTQRIHETHFGLSFPNELVVNRKNIRPSHKKPRKWIQKETNAGLPS